MVSHGRAMCTERQIQTYVSMLYVLPRATRCDRVLGNQGYGFTLGIHSENKVHDHMYYHAYYAFAVCGSMAFSTTALRPGTATPFRRSRPVEDTPRLSERLHRVEHGAVGGKGDEPSRQQ